MLIENLLHASVRLLDNYHYISSYHDGDLEFANLSPGNLECINQGIYLSQL
jgi:hypothetical protein